MHRRFRISLAPLFISAFALTACGSDGGGGEADDASIEAMLAELPESANDGSSDIMITYGDLDAAAAASERPRPDRDADTDELVDWVIPVSGVYRDDGHPLVHALLPEAAAPSFIVENDAIREELGWSIAGVDTFIELSNLPKRFTVIRGSATAKDLDRAIGKSDDGIWSLGGDDLEQNLADRTAARSLGESMRMAFDDGLLVVSRTTPPVSEWLDGPDSTMADDDNLVAIAKALDNADVYSAMLVEHNFTLLAALGASATPEQAKALVENTTTIDKFQALGVGLSSVDGEPTGTFAYAYRSDKAAADAVDSITEVFEQGESIVDQQPLSELFRLRDITATGNVVVVTVEFDDSRPSIMWQSVYRRDLVAVHG